MVTWCVSQFVQRSLNIKSEKANYQNKSDLKIKTKTIE